MIVNDGLIGPNFGGAPRTLQELLISRRDAE
jgi:hypothetical protein